MRKLLAILSMFLPLCVAGCANDTTVPRFAGIVVSHADSYGSGTGGRSLLSDMGQMRTGFDYTEQSKTDWTADIKWAFLRRDGGADVYRIERVLVDRNERSAPNCYRISIEPMTSNEKT